MTTATLVREPGLPVTSLAPMLRMVERAMRDGTWKACPVGSEASRYLRTLRWSGKADNTLKSYEPVLALFAIRHADWASLEEFCNPAGTEYIREFLDAEWGGASAATKTQRTAILRGFFKWAALERRISYNPAETIAAPRIRRRSDRQAYALTILRKLVTAQDNLRDKCALQLLCRMGLRKDELRVLQIKDIDLIRGYVLVNGKGGKIELLPLNGTLYDDLYSHIQGENRHLDEYLIYPRNQRGRPMDPSSVHRWLKRCVKNAGLPETIKTHELRHSAGDAIYRVHQNPVMAQMLLRHEHLSTTEAYLHPTKKDLAETLSALDELWVEAGD